MAEARNSMITTPTHPMQEGNTYQKEESPMILVGTNNKLLAMNTPAAKLLGVSAQQVKGQHITVLGEALASIALQPTRPGVSNLLHLSNGHTVLASTRMVVDDKQQPLGRVVTMQDMDASVENISHQTVSSPPATQQGAMPGIDTLQSQIKNMQELIDMVPRFSNNRYWQNLLVDHMNRLIGEMTEQVQHLMPVSVSA